MKKRKRPKNMFSTIFEIWLSNQFDEFQTNLLENIVFESRSIKLSSILELLKKELSYVNIAALPHTVWASVPTK